MSEPIEPEFKNGDEVVHYAPEAGVRVRGTVCHVRRNHRTGYISYDVVFRNREGRMVGVIKEIPSVHVIPVPAVDRLGELVE